MQYRTLTGLTQSTIQADRIYSSLLEATFREEQIRIASLTPKGMRRIVENNQTRFRPWMIPEQSGQKRSSEMRVPSFWASPTLQ